MVTAKPAVVPILAYHSVNDRPPRSIRGFAVSPRQFVAHIDHLRYCGFTGLTVSELVDAVRRGGEDLPARPIVLTFDDGFADFHKCVLPLLGERDLAATLYVTTGMLTGRDGMLSWGELRDVVAQGVEVGGHSCTHPELDVLPSRVARHEILGCKALLEDRLGVPVRSFAYPYGYSSPTVRRLVRDCGYESACSVKHALSSTADEPFSLARLLVRHDTSLRCLVGWLAGQTIGMAPRRDALCTRGWRLARRCRVLSRRSLAQGGR